MSRTSRGARLNRHDLEALAAADPLRRLCANRHQARWQVLGIEAPLGLGEMPSLPEPVPMLRKPTEGEDIAADYGSLGLTLRRHPLALLRPVLTRLSFQSAARYWDSCTAGARMPSASSSPASGRTRPPEWCS